MRVLLAIGIFKIKKQSKNDKDGKSEMTFKTIYEN